MVKSDYRFSLHWLKTFLEWSCCDILLEFEAPVTDFRTLFCYAEDGIDAMSYFLLLWWIIGVWHSILKYSVNSFISF